MTTTDKAAEPAPGSSVKRFSPFSELPTQFLKLCFNFPIVRFGVPTREFVHSFFTSWRVIS
jgi:hypothetical protein